MSNIRQSKEERVLARRDVPSTVGPFTFYVYVTSPESFNGRVMTRDDHFYIDIGTDFHSPGGGVTLGNVERAEAVYKALGAVIEEYKRIKAQQDQ